MSATRTYTQMEKLKKEDAHQQMLSQIPKRLLSSHQFTHRKTQETGLSLFRINSIKGIQFQKPECIQNICICSKINYTQMIEWIQELGRVISKYQFTLHVESLTKVLVQNMSSKKQTYFLSLKTFSNQILCAVLRNDEGDIMLYQKIQTSAKMQFVLSTLPTYSLQNLLIIKDETGNQDDYLYLLQAQHLRYKFVYIITQPISQQFLVEINEHFTFHALNNFSAICSKNAFKNKAVLQQQICKILEFQQQQITRFQSLFGQSILSFYPDRFFFLSKLISEKMKTSSEVVTSFSIANYLNQASSYLKEKVNIRAQFANFHLPKRAETKSLCNFCWKKKTQAVCEGCLKSQNKMRYLCIGKCYQKYHNYIQSISSNEKQEVPTNLEYFDQKCRQLQESMNQLLKIQNGSELVEQFIKMSKYKIASFLNWTTERVLLGRMQEEEQ